MTGSSSAFSRFLSGLNFTYGGSNNNRHWRGLGLKPEMEGQKVL